MNSDELVRSLVADLRPVRRLRSSGTRTLLWAAFALACVCAGAYAFGTRTDLSAKLHDPSFLAEGASLLLVFLLSGRGAFRFSVPGMERRKTAPALPLFGVLAWLLLIAARHSSASEPVAPAGLGCCVRMICLALTPTLGLWWMLRRAAPLERGWTGLLALLSAGSLAVLGTQAICAKDEPLHLLLWHFAPLLVVVLLGAGLGESLLSRSWVRDRHLAADTGSPFAARGSLRR